LRIKRLSDYVANQIAAGEVIERPASVVKELLENALDAKATSVTIDIGFGGLNQIKISDNGEGIVADDLPLALSAHATSKITELNDLSVITSMGFRGEALASIASVSKLSLSSKPAKQTHAMQVTRVDNKTQLTPCARNQGTTVDVRDLFYNAPVRRRFLKSERSEFLAIEGVVKRFAFSEPALALSLIHNGKPVLTLPAAHCDKTQLVRIKKILGKNFTDNALLLDVRCGDLALKGWVTHFDYQRSQNDKLFVYLNQRAVKDKLIYHAIKQAYIDCLHPGRYPACLLYLSVPTNEVDINVHPTKHEVRFQQPRLIHDFLVSEIKAALVSHKPETEMKPSFSEHANPSALIRESYTTNPLSFTSSAAFPEVTQDWIVLNKQFVLVKCEQEYTLVNIEQAKAQYAYCILQRQKRPLSSRPLLVPIRFDVSSVIIEKLTKHKPVLHALGIKYVITNGEVVIQAIPVALPQIDLELLINDLPDVLVSEESMAAHFVKNQTVDAYQMDTEERTALIAFVHEQASSVDWSIPLHLLQCREIMRV